jgi:hypothetical protein
MSVARISLTVSTLVKSQHQRVAKDLASDYTFPTGRVFFSASIIWGAIGPGRMFSHGAVYSALTWFFLLGAILPVLTWLAARRWPKSAARYFMIPVMFGGLGYIPPAGVYNYLCWGSIGFVFQYYIRRKVSYTNSNLCPLLITTLVLRLVQRVQLHCCRRSRHWVNH